jgi:hypothetical protein
MILWSTVLSSTVVAATVSSWTMPSYWPHQLLTPVTMVSHQRRRLSDDGDDGGEAKASKMITVP